MFVCGTFVVEKQGCKLSSPVFSLFSEKNLQSWTKLLRQLNKFHVNLQLSLLRPDILLLIPHQSVLYYTLVTSYAIDFLYYFK